MKDLAITTQLHSVNFLCNFPCQWMLTNVILLENEKVIILDYSVQFNRLVVSNSLRPHGLQHARPPLSITNSRSSLKLMSIESMMPSSHLILCRPLLLLPQILPSIRIFSNKSTLASSGQSIGVLASASVLPMNTQG